MTPIEQVITGKDLIKWGLKPGKWFEVVLPRANAMRAGGASDQEIVRMIRQYSQDLEASKLRMGDPAPVYVNIRAETAAEEANITSVMEHASELARVPTVKAVAIMPDACTAGSALGTIPVGGVAKTENAIHPAMHSADICCSVAISLLRDCDQKAVLDALHETTHFGPSGRKDQPMPSDIQRSFACNPFLKDLSEAGDWHFATQGDGNHFAFVGRVRSTGDVAIITHHGSRKPGALLYKKGKAKAEQYRRKLAPEIPKIHAWIPADTQDGADYWEALQIIRQWTKASHFAIHNLAAGRLNADVKDRFWNEHNFVFKRDGFYYHGKGATPAWDGFADDTNGLCLIPLNMAEPVLIVRGRDAENGLGFCPHGAGRNMGRSAYIRTIKQTPKEFMKEQTKGIDVRFLAASPIFQSCLVLIKTPILCALKLKNLASPRLLIWSCLMAQLWQVTGHKMLPGVKNDRPGSFDIALFYKPPDGTGQKPR